MQNLNGTIEKLGSQGQMDMVVPGKLFVFEGSDGSGKTTLSHGLVNRFKKCGIQCEWFSFPGCEPGTLGERVYYIHHKIGKLAIKKLSPTSLQLLHIAAHVDAIENRILPALNQGKHVVLDRFWWSTWAYGLVAGAERKSLEAIVGIENTHWRGVRPSRVFLIQRGCPDQETLDLGGTSIAKEYAKLSELELNKYPVSVIDNDGPVHLALDRIAQLSGITEQLRNVQKSSEVNRKRS